MSVTIIESNNYMMCIQFRSDHIRVEYETSLKNKDFWTSWKQELQTNSVNEFINFGVVDREASLFVGLPRSTFAIPFINCIDQILSDPKYYIHIEYNFDDD